MMARSWHIRRPVPVLLIALAALAGCTRSGPPAPVESPGEARMPPRSASRPVSKPPPALVWQEHLPHPDKVVVGPGETLYAVSRRYDVPLRSIIEANALKPPYRITTGGTLILPQQRFHLVQPGDTLYGISRLYGVELSTLASTNHLIAPYPLRTGETLYLPPAVEPVESVAKEALPPPSSPPSMAMPVPAEPAAPIPQERPGPAESTAQLAPLPRAAHGFLWPVQGRILSAYGAGPAGTHNDGINIAVKAGEPVRAADGGVVAYAGNALRGYGNLVLIKHPGGWMTAYAHNDTLLVKRGDRVRRGQEIAKAGATGVVSEPQLHFEIRRGSRALDPTNYLPALRASAE